MSSSHDNDRRNKIRQSRQVLAGDAVRPSPDPWASNQGGMPFSPLQRNYLLGLLGLLVIGLLIAYLVGMGIGSIFLFLLALGLVAGWLIF